jgi:16S rRNA (cytosine1402-N4)-methyltransferase
MEERHLPVMVREVLEILAPKKGGVYVDTTVGLGGHAGEILKMIGNDGKVIGIDKDETALKIAGDRCNDKRLVLKKGSFSEMEGILASEGISRIDGILIDLGVSMMQLKDLQRGFSFYSDQSLDMRMDTSQDISAWDVVNRYSLRELIRILKDYGEERRAARIAGAIVDYRHKKKVDSCFELAGIIIRAVGKRGRLHPATKTFQALRIEVNQELEELKKGLISALKILKGGGRLCVISYHSLEDRIVKNFMRENVKSGTLITLMKKPLRPGIKEKRSNVSSRSAKLRGAEVL